MTDKQTTDDLLALIPPVVRMTVRGREIELRWVTMRQLPHLWPYYDYIGRIVRFIIEAREREESQAATMIALLSADEGTLHEVLSIATGLERDFLADLDPGAFMAIASAVIDLNWDFFERCALPAARGVSDAVWRMNRAVGLKASPSSSSAATEEATSSTTASAN